MPPRSVLPLVRRQQFKLWIMRLSVSLVMGMVAGLFWIFEQTASPRSRIRAREARQKIQALRFQFRRWAQDFQSSPNGSRNLTRMGSLDSYFGPLVDSETRRGFQETDAKVQAMRDEKDAIQAIREQAAGDMGQEVAGLQAYVQAHPASAFGYFALAGTLRKAEDWDGSLDAYARSIALNGEDTATGAAARVQRGLTFQPRRDLDSAAAEFRRVIDRGTSDTAVSVSLAYLSLGDVLNQIGDSAEARRAWKQAARWDTTGVVRNAARERSTSAR